MSDTIPLIGTVQQATEQPPDDRETGHLHGFFRRSAAVVTANIPAEQFGEQLEKVMANVQSVAERFKGKMGEYSAEEIKIGLAVSAEGTIGVATAGAEASIEIKLKRNHGQGNG